MSPESLRAKAPFRFCTSFILQEATGLRAATLPQLVGLLKEVPESCVYHHTHVFLFSHHYLVPEPANDFAYWVTDILNERALGELLTSVDVMDYASLEDLRQAFIQTMERYLAAHPATRFKFAAEGEEFFFTKSISVMLPTPIVAWTLEEFASALEQVSVRSLYLHVFEARLRLAQRTNDFAIWLEKELGEVELAKAIHALDPYAHSLETLRDILVQLVHRHMPRVAV